MFIKNQKIHSKGFSLIELMLSLFLGSLLLAMVIGLYVSGVSNGAKSAKYSRLRTDMQSILTIMETDIRRAGYGGQNFLVEDSGNKITVKIAELSEKHCIIYSYDHNLDQVVDDSDKLGFCYNNTGQTVEFVTNVGGTQTLSQLFSCIFSGGIDCADGSNFVSLSDPDFIKITALTFTESTSSSATATLRNVEINLSGELTANSDYKHSVNTTVQVRNVELHEAP